jgi:hypothetical protein
MSNLRLSVIVFVFFIVGATFPSTGFAQSAKEKRKASYQAALKMYSEALKPGMTRTEVEGYLRSKGAAFTVQLEGISGEDSGGLERVKVGNEKHPWYCSENAVYIAFHFEAVRPDRMMTPSGADTLKSITIYNQAETCL